jgi:hypothetical protein
MNAFRDNQFHSILHHLYYLTNWLNSKCTIKPRRSNLHVCTWQWRPCTKRTTKFHSIGTLCYTICLVKRYLIPHYQLLLYIVHCIHRVQLLHWAKRGWGHSPWLRLKKRNTWVRTIHLDWAFALALMLRDQRDTDTSQAQWSGWGQNRTKQVTAGFVLLTNNY